MAGTEETSMEAEATVETLAVEEATVVVSRAVEAADVSCVPRRSEDW